MANCCCWPLKLCKPHRLRLIKHPKSAADQDVYSRGQKLICSSSFLIINLCSSTHGKAGIKYIKQSLTYQLPSANPL